MKSELLTVVIPTRDRLDTLSVVIEHLIAYKIPATRFLICDNFSKPSVESVLSNLPDNFEIIRTTSRLSMPANWRFALRHISTPYFTVIGDDDIIWAKRMVEILPLLEQEDIPVLFWWRYAYFWNSYSDKKSAGTLLFTKEMSVKLVDLDELFNKVYPKTLSYQWLPSVYNSIISASYAIEIFGQIEDVVPNDCISPDVASAFRICSTFKKGLHISAPLSISGISHNSNGMNLNNQDQFWSEFTSVELRPSWLNACAKPMEKGQPTELFTIVHDYFSGSIIDRSIESEPDRLPLFFYHAIIDFFDENRVCFTKKGLRDFVLKEGHTRSYSPRTVDPRQTGFFPASEMSQIKVPSDYSGNEITLIAKYLNSLT
jgi:hypothetical protein